MWEIEFAKRWWHRYVFVFRVAAGARMMIQQDRSMLRTPNPAVLNTQLTVLLKDLDAHAVLLGGTGFPVSSRAAKLSDSLFLSNASTKDDFIKICKGGALKSQELLNREYGFAIKSTELKLGTAHYVFFFAAPFRYPETNCGLLFSTTLEKTVAGAVATPFDSGSLDGVCQWRDKKLSMLEFLERHEMPAPGHRSYLKRRMEVLFERPEDYVDGVDPTRPCCIGLTGGDQRRWTHEVRIPDQVELMGGHLEAVFISDAAAKESTIKSFLEKCEVESVQYFTFPSAGRDEYDRMHQLCLDYIEHKIY